MIARSHTGPLLFPGKDLEEECIFYFRQHWIRLVGPFLRMMGASALVIIAGLVLMSPAPVSSLGLRHTTLLILSALLLFVHLDFLLHFYRYFLYVIIITDKKLHRIKKTLIAVDDHESMDLWVLQDIHKSQHGPIQNLLGFGSLVLEAQNTTLRLHFVPKISDCYDEMMRLKEQARRHMRMWQQESTGQPASVPAVASVR